MSYLKSINIVVAMLGVAFILNLEYVTKAISYIPELLPLPAL